MNKIPVIFLLLLLVADPVCAEKFTLKKCIDYAMKYSPRLQKLKINLDNQKLNTIIQKGKFAFDLSASADRDYEKDNNSASIKLSREITGGVTVSSTLSSSYLSDEESGSFSVRISKLLLGGGSILASRLQVDKSLIDEVISRNNIRRYKRELAYRITGSYYSIIRNMLTLKIQEMKLTRAKKNLEHAQERQNPLDIATAKLEIPQNEAAILRAERVIDSSLDSLKELIGMDVTVPLTIEPTFEYEEQKLNPESDVDYCLNHHEDILNVKLGLKKLEKDLKVSRSRILPRTSIYVQSGRDITDGLSFQNEPEHKAGISLSWEIGSRTERASARRAQNSLRLSRRDLFMEEQAKTRQIRDLSRKLKEAARLVRLQEQRVKLGERQMELYKDRWDNGEIDILEYIRSQNDVENSRIQLVNQKTAYLELLSQYIFVVGK